MLSLRGGVRSSGVELLDPAEVGWLGHLLRGLPGRLPVEVLWTHPLGEETPRSTQSFAVEVIHLVCPGNTSASLGRSWKLLPEG